MLLNQQEERPFGDFPKARVLEQYLSEPRARDCTNRCMADPTTGQECSLPIKIRSAHA
jgi:hypothetical protein